MANIIIYKKDGTVIKHIHQGRPGGSYTKNIRYEGNFAIVTDEYDKQYVYPMFDIRYIEVTPHRGSF